MRSPTLPSQLARIPATQPASIDQVAVDQGLGGDGDLRVAHHLVELEVQRVGHHAHRVAEHGRAGGDHRGQLGVVGALAVADAALGVGRAVPGGVDRLEHRDRVDPLADPRRHERQQVGEAGVHAGPEDRRAARLAGVDEALAVGVAHPVSGDEGGGRGDVDAGRQDAHEVADVGPDGVVAHAVGPQGEERVDVVGRRDARRFVEPAQLGDVAPDLAGAPRVAADEAQFGVGDDRPHRPLPHVARRPLHHVVGHGGALSCRPCGRRLPA